MTGIVLLPGAGMSTWLWEKITKSLNAPSLIISPRIVNNTKENRLNVTFDEMIDYHKKLISDQKWDKVIIVGHSGAGLLAGILGKEVKNVVEVIFVAANIPKNETTALDIFPDEIKQRTVSALKQQAEKDYIPIQNMENFFIPSFANNCSEQDIEFILKQNFYPEPICVITTKMNWNNYPLISKKYILCTKDKTLTEQQQFLLAGNLLISNIIKMDTDHLPMISKADEFVSILNSSIKEFS
jgi:hypothetical protein